MASVINDQSWSGLVFRESFYLCCILCSRIPLARLRVLSDRGCRRHIWQSITEKKTLLLYQARSQRSQFLMGIGRSCSVCLIGWSRSGKKQTMYLQAALEKKKAEKSSWKQKRCRFPQHERRKCRGWDWARHVLDSVWWEKDFNEQNRYGDGFLGFYSRRGPQEAWQRSTFFGLERT